MQRRISRGLTRGLLGGVIAAGLLAVGQPGASRADHIPGRVIRQFSVNSDGTPVRISVTTGTYSITVQGTYDFFDVDPGKYIADAECSVDHPYWDGVVDQVAHDFLGVGYPQLEPYPISEWQRYRYTVHVPWPPGTRFPYFDWPFFQADATKDWLDLAIDGITPEWVPVNPDVTDEAGAVMAGCNDNDHKYETVMFWLPGIRTFQIVDPVTTDNTGSLQVTIRRIF